MAALGRCPVLVERDDELRALTRLASEASAGGARVAVITGEGGTGKSRLIAGLRPRCPAAHPTRQA
jgi:predicted ATPase